MAAKSCPMLARRAGTALRASDHAYTAWKKAESRFKRIELMAHPGSKGLKRARSAAQSAKRQWLLSVDRFDRTSKDWTRCVDREA